MKPRVKNWRECPGVNKRTGRMKRGYRSVRGQCPVPAAAQHSASTTDLVSTASTLLPNFSGPKLRWQPQQLQQRYWYFTESNERGGIRDRFGPFNSNHEAAQARRRVLTLYPEKRVDHVSFSNERYPSNIPNWMKSGRVR